MVTTTRSAELAWALTVTRTAPLTIAPYSSPPGSAAVTHRAAFILTDVCGTSSA